MTDPTDTPSGLPSTYKNKAKQSDRPHPLVAEWLALHKADHLPWRHYGEERAGRVYGYYTRLDQGGHIVSLTAYEDPDRVLFAYAGPTRGDGSMGQRAWVEVEFIDGTTPRLCRPTTPEATYNQHDTTESLRKLFHL